MLALTDLVKDKDELMLGDYIQVKYASPIALFQLSNPSCRCLATPCHTQDSICFHVTDSSSPDHPGVVFTGDTLFIAGCGRFFEGTGSDMFAALDYLKSLPDKTLVCNGHEYTPDNLAFAKHIDPTNTALAALEEVVTNNEMRTGITTIGNEKEWNVFMRLDTAAVRFVAAFDTLSFFCLTSSLLIEMLCLHLMILQGVLSWIC